MQINDVYYTLVFLFADSSIEGRLGAIIPLRPELAYKTSASPRAPGV